VSLRARQPLLVVVAIILAVFIEIYGEIELRATNSHFPNFFVSNQASKTRSGDAPKRRVTRTMTRGSPFIDLVLSGAP
jgi:hypothetical protein